VRHDADLSVFLVHIILVDADGIDPEKAVGFAAAQKMDGVV